MTISPPARTSPAAPPASVPAPTGVSAGRARAIVLVLAITGVVAAGMQTLIVPLIGQLPSLLDAPAADTAWAVTATLLASAAAVPTVGRLGDLFGRRRMILVSLIPLIAGSVLCALSGSLIPMIAGRALQGLGMGVIPLGISLLREVLPAERVGSAVAMMSASMGIGGAIALPVAAAIAEYASWRGMFWAFAGLAAACLVLALWVIPGGARAQRDGRRFDLLGAVLLAASLVCLLLAVSKGAQWGWVSGATIGCAVAAALLLGVWVLQQLRSRSPLVNLRSLASGSVAVTNVASFLIGFAMYAQSLVIPQLLQLPTETGYGLGQSMLQMALWLIPSGVTMMLVSPLGARLTAWRGPKATLVAGAFVVAAGYGVSLLWIGAIWGLVAATVVISAGVGLAYGAIPMLVMGGVAADETAAANAFNTLVRSVGTSAASAVIGVALASFVQEVGGNSVPELGGFQLTLAIGAAAALAAVVVGLLIPVARRAPRGAEA
ncbi:MAG: MFS transporter [Microbacterium sp.]